MRKVAKYIILVLTGFAAGYLLIRISGDYNDKKEAEKRVQTLPEAQFISLTGDSVNLHDFNPEIPMIIIYFRPDCDYCRYEAREIGQNAAAFQNCLMIMITSDDSVKRVENFCIDNHLCEITNFEVLFDSGSQFEKIFGQTKVPAIFIYGSGRELKKQFFGETKPEALLNEMNKL